MRTTVLTGALLVGAFTAELPADPSGLVGNALRRAPYVQNVGRTHVTILWHTTLKAVQRVEYGRTVGVYDQVADDPVHATEHEVTLTGLEPGTRYFYRIVDGDVVLANGVNLHFRTDAGRDLENFEFFVTGDIGVDDPSAGYQIETQQMIRTVSPPAHLGLLAGDIVYPDGDSRDYDTNLMTPWADLLANTPVWPALGNHDWQSDPEENFVREWALPNNEHYYSFDYGNAHFIALDTMRGRLYEESAQRAWLEQDLAANRTATWTFVYFHYPLITCTYKGNEPRMAEQLMPLFEAYGVDVVFTGHAHTYERLYPMRDGVPVHQEQDPYYVDPGAPIYIVSGCGAKVKTGEPTSYCGPTAFYLDERILFTQVWVRDQRLIILTIDSLTGAIVDGTSIEKSLVPTEVYVAVPGSRLLGAVPNPFNPATSIPFELSSTAAVQLDVFDVNGRFVAQLADDVYAPGLHRVVWRGLNASGLEVPSGLYVIRMRSGEQTHTRKLTLMR